MGSSKGEEVCDEGNEKIYVAVGNEWKACKSSLEWVNGNLEGKMLCLLHVYVPSKYANLFGMKFPVSSLAEEEVIAHREKEKQDMDKMLEDCARICRARFKVEKLYIEKDNVENGLVEVISQHRIERLVMGAASDKKNSSFFTFDFRKMTEPKSKKASYVRQHAPAYCHIWFTCKGQLIYTREAIIQLQLNGEDQNGKASANSRLNKFTSELSTSPNRVNFEESSDRSSIYSLSPASSFYQSSVPASESTSYHSGADDQGPPFQSLSLSPKPEGMPHHLHSPNALRERNMDNAMYNHFDQAITEAEIAKQEAIKEAMRRCKAEKSAIEAINKANATESMYYEELRRRKELEEELAMAKEIFKRYK